MIEFEQLKAYCKEVLEFLEANRCGNHCKGWEKLSGNYLKFLVNVDEISIIIPNKYKDRNVFLRYSDDD